MPETAVWSKKPFPSREVMVLALRTWYVARWRPLWLSLFLPFPAICHGSDAQSFLGWDCLPWKGELRRHAVHPNVDGCQRHCQFGLCLPDVRATGTLLSVATPACRSMAQRRATIKRAPKQNLSGNGLIMETIIGDYIGTIIRIHSPIPY